MKEIEIKIKLDNRDELIKKVESLGGKKTEEGNELDYVYDDGKGFFDAHRVLRLRKKNGKNILTYKERLKKPDHQNLLERLELETEFENFDIMQQIVSSLGFFVHRIKEKGFVDYKLDGLKIEFHTMPFLGDFVEIECEDEERLSDLLEKLGLSLKMGINKDYTNLFKDYCLEHDINKETPQTFEEEKKHHLSRLETP